MPRELYEPPATTLYACRKEAQLLRQRVEALEVASLKLRAQGYVVGLLVGAFLTAVVLLSSRGVL